MIFVAWQLLSHQSHSFIVLITSFSMIKENRLSRKKFVDERRETDREGERAVERTLENDTKTKPRDQARGPSPTPTLSQIHFVLHEGNI